MSLFLLQQTTELCLNPDNLLKETYRLDILTLRNDELSNFLNTRYGSGNWIENFSNNQLFLNYELIEEKNIDQKYKEDINFLLKYEWIKNTYTAVN